MKRGSLDIEKFRTIVKTYWDMHMYSSALYWADKVVALTGNPKDIYWLAQCMYTLKQYHRAAYLLRSRNLHKTFILCNLLTVRCLFEASELDEALKMINTLDVDSLLKSSVGTSSDENALDNYLFDDTPKNKIYSSFLLLKGKILEAMDNRGLASDCYKKAVQCDVYCFEAFDALVKYQMLNASEEQDLLNSLPITQQCTGGEVELLNILYRSKLKKYHTPTVPSETETKILNEGTPFLYKSNVFNANFSLPLPSHTFISPSVISTPKTVTNAEISKEKDDTKSTEMEETEVNEDFSLLKLKDSLEIYVSQAERLYYNCEFEECSKLTEAILKQDPYHSDCLPIHISCQVELKQSNKLFSLAHNLVDIYPTMAISWFAVGCYYYIIGKNDLARRFLIKATCLDRLFGPACLAFGHSFAAENEHDQAMAAYFKASQLMKGCHLPLLYIGLECGLTNNVRLANQFFDQAETIAPNDPYIMHEKGVIAFQNLQYSTAESYFAVALNRVKRIKKGLVPSSWISLLNNLGHTCRKLKKYDEALCYHEQALLLSPQSASIYSAIAYVYALMGCTEESVDWFHKSLGLKRDDTFSSTMLSYVIEQLANEAPAFPAAPDKIPSKFDIHIKQSNILLDENTQPQSDMSMSIEIDMQDSSSMMKE